MSKDKPWYEREDFWEDTESLIFGEKRLEQASDEMEQVIALMKLDPSMKILDMCCGVGRHTIELARRGFDVTGVDRTQRYIDRAAAQAEKQQLEIRLVCEDMRNFCEPEKFDAAINLFTSFGYFDDPADDKLAALNIYNSLKPGGVLLMEMGGKETLARIFQPRDWYEQEDGTIILEERNTARDWSWMENRWILLKGDKRIEQHFCHRPYSATELKNLLLDCGFSTAQAFGSLEGSPYDHEAKRLAVLARK
ncbi:MAG: class I SAM-dependent methyltransferase [candidate division Zixibacteria bacterium]|nr:class I SAM-dependent methyltransferase [candidate division Zixibacteria bacterium]MDH3936284.1 class I SAM-dependent methyltransferase [candidate division Zixibacteria bacterium]MDH4034839.1 class I SAM-dependent methyltransferase [candidate division Zixibacteria bacterium]